MKKGLKILVSVLIMCFILSGCSENKNIKSISLNEFKQKIENKETFVVYVGNKDCVHCNNYMPTLKKVLKDYNITIYQIDNSKLTEEEYGNFKTYVSISGTPTIAFIKNGEEESTLDRIVGETDEETTIKKFKSNGYIK